MMMAASDHRLGVSGCQDVFFPGIGIAIDFRILSVSSLFLNFSLNFFSLFSAPLKGTADSQPALYCERY